MRPTVSVIITTKDRPRELKRLLESLTKSTFRDFEIIIVDTSCRWHNQEIINQYRTKLNIKYYKIPDSGLAASRNFGALKASGNYLLFVDDDNVIEKDCIKHLLSAFQKYKKIGVVQPLQLYYKSPDTIWSFYAIRTKIGIVRWLYVNRKLNENKISKLIKKDAILTESFQNVFMIPCKLFKEIGLFDSRIFRIHMGEEDLYMKIRRLGYLALTVPKAIVWHDVTPKTYLERMFRKVLSRYRAYFIIRNRLVFLKRYWSLVNALLYFLIKFPQHFVAIMSYPNTEIREKFKVLRNYLEGVIDGLFLCK